MSADEVVFMDPPGRKFERSQQPKIITELKPLRDRPGEWARVRHDLTQNAASVFAFNLAHGKFSGIAEGEYEAVSRSKNGRGDVFARYIGGAS